MRSNLSKNLFSVYTSGQYLVVAQVFPECLLSYCKRKKPLPLCTDQLQNSVCQKSYQL